MTGSQGQTPGAAGTRVSRRRLLALGTAGALSFALARPGSFPQTAEAKAPKGAPGQTIAPLAIGFNSGLADDALIVDAGSLRSGEPGLAESSVRLRVLGMCPMDGSADLAMLRWLTVDVGYTPYHDTPFMAWSFRNGSVAQTSTPVTITVPIEAQSGLHLLVAFQPSGASEPVRTAVRFSTGGEPGTSKLASGIYVIALDGMGYPLPDWKKHQLVTENTEHGGTCQRLYEKTRSEYVAVRFPHLLVSIS